MRLGCLVLVTVFTLVACCVHLANAERTSLVKNPDTSYKYNHKVTTAEKVKHYLKGSKMATAADEERAFPMMTQLRGFFDKIAKGSNVKIAVDKVKKILNKETRHPSISVLISLLKMLAVVGVISVASGYIIYRVSNS